METEVISVSEKDIFDLAHPLGGIYEGGLRYRLSDSGTRYKISIWGPLGNFPNGQPLVEESVRLTIDGRQFPAADVTLCEIMRCDRKVQIEISKMTYRFNDPLGIKFHTYYIDKQGRGHPLVFSPTLLQSLKEDLTELAQTRETSQLGLPSLGLGTFLF